MKNFKKKKSLGQHFLRSHHALGIIMRAATLKGTETILEVGPGEGVLTEKLLELSKQVIAVEKDRRLIPVLEKKFSSEIEKGRLILIEGDILKFNIEKMLKDNYMIVANIPYYITGMFLRKFLSAKRQPRRIVVMLQKEVAERIVARGRKESILSISVKAYGKPVIVGRVPRKSFSPPPKVDSSILVIESISRDFFKGIDEKTFFKLIKTGFSQKRKQLGGKLRSIIPREDLLRVFKECGVNYTSRAEELGLEKWACIAQFSRIDVLK